MRFAAINIQPDPVKFIQMTTTYWEYLGNEPTGWENIANHFYKFPPGCEASTTDCRPDQMNTTYNHEDYTIVACQKCEHPDDIYSIWEWLFTANPGVFGLAHGWANPTGFALIAVLTTMVICSLPFVRRGGYFEVYYTRI